MATTKIWPVRDSLRRLVEYAANPEKTEIRDLRQALHYVENNEKTIDSDERFCFVTGIGCEAETAYEEMTAVKQRFGKTSGNVAYHAYQSFKPGEVTPKRCHELGIKLAHELWGRRFQVLVATHLDKQHLHNHFLINSVSFVDGKKFNDDMRCYYRFREASDRLCREQALSVIKSPGGHTPRSIYFAEKRGEPTAYNLMREAIDNALKLTIVPRDFKRVLREQGYELCDDPNRKYATIKRVGSSKAVRLFRLGEEYDIPAIRERIYEIMTSPIDFSNRPSGVQLVTVTAKLRESFKNMKKVGGLRGLYLHYCYLMGIYPKNNPRRPLSPQMKEDVRRLDELTKQVKLLCREKLSTAGDAERFIESKKSSMASLTDARSKCYNRLRRCAEPAEIEAIRSERDALTKQIGECRKDIRTAEGILSRSIAMRVNLRCEERMRTRKEAIGIAKHTERSERG